MSNTSSNSPVITRRFYPTLSTVLDLDDIPDTLGFIKSGIITLFDNIYYKDLQFSKSPKGDAAFYSLSIVSPQKLALEIPGTGVKIVLNPDITDSGISTFPITIDYQWKVLGHIRAIGSTDFTDPQAIFELALVVLNLSQEQALSRFIMEFVEPASVGVTLIEQFVSDINTKYSADWGSSIPAPTSSTTLSEILELIHQISGEYGALVAFGTYIADTSPSAVSNKLKRYFSAILPSDIEEYITDLLIPKFEATVKLSAGIEFPRNLLKPVYTATGENPYDGTTGHTPYQTIPITIPVDPINPEAPNALLSVGEAIFYVNTDNGIGYTADLVVNTVTPFKIGNTPIVLSITNAKIDLSKETNFPEIDADGRPTDFKGVYIESTSVALTGGWDDTVLNVTNLGSAVITGRELIIGTHGGFSGIFELTGPAGVTTTDSLYFKIPGALEVELSKFNMEFIQDVLNSTEIEGKIHLPFLNELGSTSPATINFDLTADGTQNPLLWTLNAEIASIPTLFLPFGLLVSVTDLTISFDENGVNTVNGPFGIGGTIKLPNYFKDNATGSVAPVITLNATVDNSTGSEVMTFSGNTTTLNIFGLKTRFEHFNVIVTDGLISTVEIDGMLAFGKAGSPLSAEVHFDIDFDFHDQLFAIQTTAASTFQIAGIEITINEFYLLLDNNGIYDPSLAGNTTPSNLISSAGLAPSHIEGSLKLPFLKGATSGLPEPILFDVDIHPNETFTLTAKAGSGNSNLPTLNLGIVEIGFSALELDYEDGQLISASGAGKVTIPEWLDANGDPVEIDVEYSADNTGKHRIEVSASAGTLAVKIKELEVSLTSFMIEWDQTGVVGSGIGGEIEIPNPEGGDSLNLGLTVEISNDGFIVEGIAAGNIPSFTIAKTVELGLESIRVEKNDTDWCVGVGNAFIEIIKSQPPIDKILPRKILIKKLKVCSTGDVEFEAGIAWGNDDLEEVPMQQDGFELYIPIKKSDLDGIKVEGIKIIAEKKSPGLGISVELIGAGFNLGPVKASASGFGLGADFTFPAANQNGVLGPVDVGLNLELPNTFMLSIDAGPVSGGGFISWDDPRFIGAMHLKIAKFNINAICILDTKLPNGVDGFALLAMMTMEFSPGIQVGFGFSITGFGGMLALNRTVNGDSLRDGLKEGNLDEILFPENILDRIDYLVQQLDGGFPIMKDRFVIGPMIKGSWGTDALVTIEAGFIIEIPSFTILLPGVLKIGLTEQQDTGEGKEESIAILDIKVAILGEINFEKKYIYIDASIFDSQILGMRIQGDMAFRLRWGDRPTFIFSIGGFHPDFEIPQGLQLQKMNRMSIVIINKPKFQVMAETYFAITSNTVQLGIGAKILLDLVIIGVEAGLYFDTIFYFNPFRFQVAISAHGAILIGGVPILSFGASIEVMGPSPWEFRGEAYVEIPIIGEQKVSFNVIKDNRSLTEIPSIALLPELRRALTQPSNWESQLMIGKHDHIILRKTTDADANAVQVHPISQFQVSQKIIPFNHKMKKFGDLRIEGADYFEVEDVKVNGESLDIEYAKDFFAPLQFRTETNAEVAVELPSFEKYDSGIRASSQKVQCGQLHKKQIEHDVVIIDPLLNTVSTTDPNSTTATAQVTVHRMTVELERNASSQSKLSAKHGENQLNSEQRIQWEETTYYIINKYTRVPIDMIKRTYQASLDKLDEILENASELEEVYTIIQSDQFSTMNVTVQSQTEAPASPQREIINNLFN